MFLSAAAACSSSAPPSNPAPVEPAAAVEKPAAVEPAALVEPAPTPVAAAPEPPPPPIVEKPQPGKAHTFTGAMSEIGDYSVTPDGQRRPFVALVVAPDETLLNPDDPAYSWHPGAGNGGGGYREIDIALIEKGGVAMFVLQPFGGRRTTLPISFPAAELEPWQWMVEERADLMVMIRVGEMGGSLGVEGETEAYLIAWDTKRSVAKTVEHWKGNSDTMPAWAIPQE